jgi:hypothetical protein
MSCRRTRRELVRLDGSPPSAPAARHLAGCSPCHTFSVRLAGMQRHLREHHANAVPEPGFAARVRARLESDTVEVLGREALRLLPAGLAAVVLLGWLAWSSVAPDEPDDDPAALTADSEETEVVSPTEDLLSWVLEEAP